MSAVCVHGKGAYAASALDLFGYSVKVCACHHRHRRAAERYELRVQVFCRFDGIAYQLFIGAHYGVHFGQRRNEYIRANVIPSRLVMGGVGGVAARSVVCDRHPAELIHGRAYSRSICGVAGYHL